MGNLFTAGLFRQMLRSATPVGLAAMGGLMTEHAGIMNIGMDGMILMGAFTAVAVSWLAGSAWLGLVAAILVGILVGLFFALFVVKFQSDEFIIGTALNIFAGGLTVFLLRTLFQVKGTFQGTPDRPVVGLPQVDLGFLKQIPFLGAVQSDKSSSPLTALSHSPRSRQGNKPDGAIRPTGKNRHMVALRSLVEDLVFFGGRGYTV